MGIRFWTACLFSTKGVFGDIKSAGIFIKDNIPEEKLIFSNEIYKPQITGNKLSFWSKRRINFIDNLKGLPPSSILVLHSAYGGMKNYQETKKMLLHYYNLKVLRTFNSELVPLLPEVMEEPFAHQNPTAWVFRYIPQHFETTIYEIISKKG